MTTALTALVWLGCAWLALGIASAAYALYRIHQERKGSR